MANVEYNDSNNRKESSDTLITTNVETRGRTVVNRQEANLLPEQATTHNSANAFDSKQTMLNRTNTPISRPTMPNEGERVIRRSTTPNGRDNARLESRQTVPNESTERNNDVPKAKQEKERLPLLDNAQITLTGTTIEGFTIGELINNKSGEALLYKCKDSKGREYAIKYYQRPLSEYDLERHDEIVEKLKVINVGVVQIISTGVYNGHLYEIMPFYNAGSLRDRLKKKLFSEKEIKDDILPRLLPILKSIHDKGIYHSDIKPDNIMYNPSQTNDLILIDFGISKITQGGGTTYTTVAKGTPDYQAPESFKGILHPETDYYALGITLFELMVGRTPTAYIKDIKDVERAAFEDIVPQPDSMTDDMYRLIYFLTFDSIRNRKDRNNHNNRWIYEDVKQWLIDGNPSWQIPSISIVEDPEINIRFGGKMHESMTELLFAMAGDWERGCDFITRPGGGLVTELAKSASRNKRLMPLSTEIKDFVDTANRSGQSGDVILFEFIYQYGENIKPIFWKGNTFRSLDELGRAVFRTLSAGNAGTNPFYELFSENLLDLYAGQNHELGTTDLEKIQSLHGFSFENGGDYEMFLASYVLMDEKRYILNNGESIKTPAGLKAYLAREGSRGNLQGFIELCKEFIDESGGEKEGFKAWIEVNKRISNSAEDTNEEIRGLSSISNSNISSTKRGLEVSSANKDKHFGVWGLILGLIICSMTVIPFVMFIRTIIAGNTASYNQYFRYAFLIATISLPVLPLFLAKILCIPRNNVTNTCFRFVSVICRVLKYDTIIAAAGMIYEQYSKGELMNNVLGIIYNSYSWLLYNFRAMIGFEGSDEILDSIATKIGVSEVWFNDVVRLLLVFIIYTILIGIFRRRKNR